MLTATTHQTLPVNKLSLEFLCHAHGPAVLYLVSLLPHPLASCFYGEETVGGVVPYYLKGHLPIAEVFHTSNKKLIAFCISVTFKR